MEPGYYDSGGLVKSQNWRPAQVLDETRADRDRLLREALHPAVNLHLLAAR